MPQDREEFALPMNGKKVNIRKKDFLQFAETCHIPGEAAERMIRFLLSKKELFLKMSKESYLPEDMKESFCDLIKQRFEALA